MIYLYFGGMEYFCRRGLYKIFSYGQHITVGAINYSVITLEWYNVNNDYNGSTALKKIV